MSGFEPYFLEIVWPSGNLRFKVNYSTVPLHRQPEALNFGGRSFASHHMEYVGEAPPLQHHQFHVLDSLNQLEIVDLALPLSIVHFDWRANCLTLISEEAPNAQYLPQLQRLALPETKNLSH